MIPILFLVLFFGAFLMVARMIRHSSTSELNEHLQTRNRCGLTGAEIARLILEAGGAHSVQVIDVGPNEPSRYQAHGKRLELDHNIFRSRSLTAMAIASRTATQAIQHMEKYPPYLWRREALRLNRAAVLIALIALATALAARLASIRLVAIGIVLGWTGLVILNLSTLAVEWNANQRALKMLAIQRLIDHESAERDELGHLLRSAAWHDTAAILDAFRSPFGPIRRLFRRSTS